MTTLPRLTADARAQALKNAIAARKERSELLIRLKAGQISLHEVLDRTDTVAGKIRIRPLLEALPGIGKIRAGQLLDHIGISERRRVRGLDQKAKLLDLFPPQK
ncbi:integration host factor, actinobacterial type [Streptomyces violascens]|uniref:integration host factor, actinobacterial type n=1 Tax=Streptomyces violascens TaxID=67381 RepID=UPI003647BD5E